MKYPLYVFKRVNGQIYICGVGQGRLEEMIQKKTFSLLVSGDFNVTAFI